LNYVESPPDWNWTRGQAKTSDGRVIITWDITGDKPKEVSRGSYARFSRKDDLWLPPVIYNQMYKQACALCKKYKEARTRNRPQLKLF
jgi:hypothetical protein